MNLSQLYRAVFIFVEVVRADLHVIDDQVADSQPRHTVLLDDVVGDEYLQIVGGELLILRTNEYAVLVRHLDLVIDYLQLPCFLDPIGVHEPLAENGIVARPRDRIVSD